MSKDNGGPAFPSKSALYTNQCLGMTLRDYFAAKVCAAMASTIQSDNDYYRAKSVASRQGYDGLSEWFAAASYKQADAMLAERAK
jgi:hypothetical protein